MFAGVDWDVRISGPGIQVVVAKILFPVFELLGVARITSFEKSPLTKLVVAIQKDRLDLAGRFDLVADILHPSGISQFLGERSGNNDIGMLEILFGDGKESFVDGLAKDVFEKRTIAVVRVTDEFVHGRSDDGLSGGVDVDQASFRLPGQFSCESGLSDGWHTSNDEKCTEMAHLGLVVA